MCASHEGTITLWNPGAEYMFGYPASEMLGQPFCRFGHPFKLSEAMDITNSVREGRHVAQLESVRRHKGGYHIPVCITASPLLLGGETGSGCVLIIQDITDRKRSEQIQAMLAAELDHRVKNTLTVILSLVAQTAGSSRDVDDLTSKLNGRIRALARAYALLAKAKWNRVSLRELINSVVGVFVEGRSGVTITGPDIPVLPSHCQPLCLAFHELATNSIKSGSLSLSTGALDVHWGLVDETVQRVWVRWQESNGPRVHAPARFGFGTQLIREGLAHQLHADVIIEYRSEGLVCTVAWPVDPDKA